MANYLDELGLTTLVRLIANKLNSVHRTAAASLNDLNERKANVYDLNILLELTGILDMNISNIEQYVEDNELVVAEALIDLNNRKADNEDVPEVIPISGTEINTLF